MRKIFATICATCLLLTGCTNPLTSSKVDAPVVEEKPAQVDTKPKPKSDLPITIPPPAVKPSVEQKPSADQKPSEEKPSNKFEFRAEDLVIPETTILPPIPYTVPPPSSTEIPAPQSYPSQNPAPKLNHDSNLSLDEFKQKFATAAADFDMPEINIDNFALDYHEGENVLHGNLSANVAMEIVFNKDTNKVKSVWFSGNVSDENDEKLATFAFVKTMKTFKPETSEMQAQSLIKTLNETLQPYETDSVNILRSEISRNGMHYIVSFTPNKDFLWAIGAL